MPIPSFHRECYSFTSLQISDAFLAATEFSFQPSISEVRRRRNLIQTELTDALQNGPWFKTLPREVWHMISEFLVEEYAVVKSERANEILSNSTETLLDFSSNVYVQYTVIDGIRYVSGLSNSAARGSELLVDAKSMPAIQRVDVGEDHLGVRQLLLDTREQSSINYISSLWWRHITKLNANLKVRVVMDVCLYLLVVEVVKANIRRV
jgi:hypothetical protein